MIIIAVMSNINPDMIIITSSELEFPVDTAGFTELAVTKVCSYLT